MERAEIEKEAARLRERLVNHPHPYAHGALYAAQQALDWVLNPHLSASPAESILRFQGVSTDCRHSGHSEPSSKTNAEFSGGG